MNKKKEEILNLFRKKNYRLTNIRELIIDIFVEHNHINFNDIIRILKENNSADINVMSVYNTLDLLISEHIVFTNSFDGKQLWYNLVDNPSIHLICDSCQNIIHIDKNKVNKNKLNNDLAPILNSVAWKPVHYKIECHGICQNCIISKNDKHNHFESDLD
ncbi:Fur family transcriptional regulator [Spiroplasma endosymbiont of Amphibalanus improvisus]|uniref:Fur family transcriptional regulator n=1 Tax=Spiroplasma endosymbiont of Amphibalanus improvisus TaxID=3066327 RepID=UPI00313F18E1